MTVSSMPQYGIMVSRDVMIEMRDGVRLATDVYRPAGPDGEPAEGRQAVGLPRRRLPLHEGIAVAGGERLDHRVLGGVGLEHDPAGATAAPGAPPNLMEQLVGALGGAHVATR